MLICYAPLEVVQAQCWEEEQGETSRSLREEMAVSLGLGKNPTEGRQGAGEEASGGHGPQQHCTVGTRSRAGASM